MNKSHQNDFSTFFLTAMHLLALLAFLQTKMTNFPTLSYTSTSETPNPFQAEPGAYGLLAEPPRISHHREYPPSLGSPVVPSSKMW